MKKRFLAALLSLCMTLTMLPTTAFAAVSDSLGTTRACLSESLRSKENGNGSKRDH